MMRSKRKAIATDLGGAIAFNLVPIFMVKQFKKTKNLQMFFHQLLYQLYIQFLCK